MSNGKDNLEVGLKAFAGLLCEFRSGNIVNKKVVRQSLEQHLMELSRRWDQRFPGLPENYFPYSSFVGVSRRGVRDKYLKEIIVKLLKPQEHDNENRTIINPACVSGRHAKDIALSLKYYRVIGTDIDSRLNWFYEHILRSKTPDNYKFKQDNIFNPKVNIVPNDVLFFGACGSLSDAIMDFAIGSNCPYLICRTCCHENIGENTQIRPRLTFLNWAFRAKNIKYSRIKKKKKGYYFSPNYSKEKYPRSKSALSLVNSDELLEIARNSVDSDICRTIIDLDRYLYLAEHGYNVWYRTEMFVAENNGNSEC